MNDQWATGEWPDTEPAADVDSQRLRDLIAQGFGKQSEPELALNLALVAAHRGGIVAETYGPATNKDTSLISWSMAKSFVHAMIGCLVDDGKLSVDEPAPVPEWSGDGRSDITVQHLLNMTSGLEWVEDYVDEGVSHVIEMLFGSGQVDTAAYARRLPLAAEPGTEFNYSSGTTNILARIGGDLIGDGKADTHAYLTERIFEPLNMTSALPKFDEAGTFVGSSFLHATARDFTRFGQLYLNDGQVNGERLIPPRWAEAARSPVTVPLDEEDFGYGAHWWLWDAPVNGFAAHGYEGQYVIVIPERDLVVTRLGKTPSERKLLVTDWLAEIIECFPIADRRTL